MNCEQCQLAFILLMGLGGGEVARESFGQSRIQWLSYLTFDLFIILRGSFFPNIHDFLDHIYNLGVIIITYK